MTQLPPAVEGLVERISPNWVKYSRTIGREVEGKPKRFTEYPPGGDWVVDFKEEEEVEGRPGLRLVLNSIVGEVSSELGIEVIWG